MFKTPRYVRAAIAALRLRGAQPQHLAALDGREWDLLLAYCDVMRLTLPLGRAAGEYLPDHVRRRISQDAAGSALHAERIRADYAVIAAAFHSRGVDHLVLKGFSLPAEFGPEAERVQYDLDLYCPAGAIAEARDALGGLGYAAVRGYDDSPSDHLPAMIRPSNWRWRGDYFDPEMPVAVDLHFQFWNAATDRIEVRGLEDFWERRILRASGFPALDTPDCVGYGALHAVRHLLHGTVSVRNFYDMAQFLHRTAGDREFWLNWKALHDDSLRRLEAVCFTLASRWFNCQLAPEAEQEAADLPGPVRGWLAEYGDTPLPGAVTSNKHALWLHLGLLDSSRERKAVLMRSLFPRRLPHPDAVDAEAGCADGSGSQGARALRYLRHVAARALHHARLLPSTLYHGTRWWWKRQELGTGFAAFLLASFFYTLGMYIFFFLYNLYLLDLGYKEDFLGLATGALAAGGIAGTLPAGWLGRKFGLHKTLIACFTLVPLLLVSRALFTARTPQLAFSFFTGAAAAIWGVSIAPALAGLTTERNRPFGFSLVFSTGIGIGVLGAAIGGVLPGWMARLGLGAHAADAKRSALLVSCAVIVAAIVPGSRLKFPAVTARGKGPRARNPFLRRYLPAIAAWSIATGAFSPFINAWLAGPLRLATSRIGLVISAAQAVQVVAVLAAPAVFRRFGLLTGILYTQLATAGALALLSGASTAVAAGVIYSLYAALQWMSEPGIYALLMNQVPEEDRTSAAALNALVISIFQAVSAVGAGWLFARFGYPPVMLAIAGEAVAAALLFRALLQQALAASPACLPPAGQPIDEAA